MLTIQGALSSHYLDPNSAPKGKILHKRANGHNIPSGREKQVVKHVIVFH